MSAPLLIAFPGNESLCEKLSATTNFEVGDIELRRFPDGESYVRYRTPPAGRNIALLCSLDRPNQKFLPLLFCAVTARELGAKSVGLISPYLGYMRQDRRFHQGEAVTSAQFARWLSGEIDWLLTVDPHLHRYRSLDDIYSVDSVVLHAASLISQWIAGQVQLPLLIGPDSESEQWVSSVAQEANAPFVVLNKIRRGDRNVEVSVPQVEKWRDHTPVLVDDIISTGHTMIETINHLLEAGMRPPICIGVHGIFADNAYDELRKAGAARIVTTNTIAHPSNEIDVVPLMVRAAGRDLSATGILECRS